MLTPLIERYHKTRGSVASWNGGVGINVLTGTLTGNTADSNSRIGILVSGDGTLTGNKASDNSTDGINVGTGTLTGNTAHDNLGNSSLTGNTASNNGRFWIEVGASSTLTGNTASANNVGFNVVCPVNVVGNTAVGNTQFDVDVNALGAVRCNFINTLINTLGP